MEEILTKDQIVTTPQNNFGWKFAPLQREEAMRLAHASRMDGAEYSMLREQFTLLVEDKIASVCITPPPAVSYQKVREHCLTVATNLEVAITVRRAPGGQIVCWKATAQEMKTREHRMAVLQSRREKKPQEKVASSEKAKRQSPAAHTTLA